MRITIPPDLESAITEYAAERCQSPEDLALMALRERFVPVSPMPTAGETLAAFLGGHLGVLSSSRVIAGGADLSRNSGRKFAEVLLEKRKQGRL